MFNAAQTEIRTPVEALRQRAQHQPDRVAYRFLSFPGADGPEETSLTYGELQTWARAVAVRLRQDATAGDHPGFDRTTSATARCLTPARPLARWSALAAAAEGMMISPFSIILASYAELVATAVGSAVPVISVIRGGRSHARHANTIGAFTAPFPLPIHVHGRTPLALIRQCHQLICALTERMDYPPADMITTVPTFRGFPADSYFSDVSINFLQFQKKTSMRAGDRTAEIELTRPVSRARNTTGNALDRPRRVVGLQFAAANENSGMSHLASS
jgi:hypothetical protein